jgi:hypothetical protein
VKYRLKIQQLGAGHNRIDCRVLQRNTNTTANLVRLGSHVETGDACDSAGLSKKRDEDANSR